MKKIIVFTGAGISAESGIKTFRDSDGLWEEFKIEDVATWKGWVKDRSKVIDFYNTYRRRLKDIQPNDAHKALAKLEEKYEVIVITQNVDDLHERGGSSNIIHLHGELTKARSTMDPNLVYDIGYEDIKIGDKCDRGSQLRPHIVWFGESVPMMDKAAEVIFGADIIIVIGTSLLVYPASGLVEATSPDAKIYYIDPKAINNSDRKIELIKEKAGIAVPKLVDELLKKKYIKMKIDRATFMMIITFIIWLFFAIFGFINIYKYHPLSSAILYVSGLSVVAYLLYRIIKLGPN